MQDFRAGPAHARAFTLVEMSIVLVIVALIVGGVIVGRDLVHQSQIKNVISQINKYNSATNAFRTKYAGIPGDLGRAVAFGLADPACPAGVGPTTPTAPGCNGNGDSLLTEYTEYAENMGYWYHLSRADMLDDQMDGMTMVFGRGAPEARMRSRTGFYIAGNVTIFPARNVFSIGMDDVIPDAYHLLPLEAWSIDNRIDDGMPLTGIVKVPQPAIPPTFVDICYDGTSGEYIIYTDEPVCAVFIRAGF